MTPRNRGASWASQLSRAKLDALFKDKKWREAMAMEVKDIRKIAKKAGNPRKYNEAMLEILEYFKCLEKHSLLI